MLIFLITCIFMGIGLAVDSAVVSMTNGLSDKKMSVKKNFLISLNFGLFQGIMPLIGYFISSAFIVYLEKFIPWIALILLGMLGGKSIVETIIERNKKRKNGENNLEKTLKKAEIIDNSAETFDKNELFDENKNIDSELKEKSKLNFSEVIMQGIATSIDALCVGIVIADYTRIEAFICTGIITIVTFILSYISTNIGKKFGFRFEEKAELFSGIILILVGIEICITGLI